MGIAKGSDYISNLKLGDTQVKSVYLGGNKIWSKELFEYDYETDTEYSEVDILYTTDTHLSWKGGASNPYKSGSPQMFSLSEVAGYKDKLWDNNIPAFAVDCGDWVHGGEGVVSSYVDEIINYFKNFGTKGYTKYLGVTYGNHEWYNSVTGGDASVALNYFNRIGNDIFTACNLWDGWAPGLFTPYRTLRIGSKKIALIGIGYPSPNGTDGPGIDNCTSESFTRWNFENDVYRFVDSYGDSSDYSGTASIQESKSAASKSEINLYNVVQGYIDMFKNDLGFDYVIAFTHMDTYDDEDYNGESESSPGKDNRFYSRADFLIKNTSGLDMVIPGHWNYQLPQKPYYDKSGREVLVAPCDGSSFNSFGRIQIKSTGISVYLLDELSDLEVI